MHRLTRAWLSIILAMALFVLVGCGAAPVPTADQKALEATVEARLSATLTASAPTSTNTPAATAMPALTATPTNTPTQSGYPALFSS
jgi:hypothetical protein